MKKLLFPLMIALLGSCSAQTKKETTKAQHNMGTQELDTITLGGGCYWCMEAVFQRMKGVVSSESGFSGGFVKNPAYREVCNGTTGHAEVVQIVFDKKVTSLEKILAVYFTIHDPTTLNKQGADEGTQYRSVVLYRNEKQKETILDAIKKLTEEKVYTDPIVTEISPFAVFYKADEYHQNYYNQNKQQPYCQYVVKSKVDKFEKLFSDIKK
ncbi:MAG TPA: peptide-methionine (S)-S-oxide reductase MsrA [Candidatus Enterocola sp.]|nr:peptide-methionine (S)-S-oxide reductase MsrA [Candidatus Enterocola sp.]